jgi:lysophospholipase L1-like esterase
LDLSRYVPKNRNHRKLLGLILFLFVFFMTRPFWCPEFLYSFLLTWMGFIPAAAFYFAAVYCFEHPEKVFLRRNAYRLAASTFVASLGLLVLELIVSHVSPPPRFLPRLQTLPNRFQRMTDIDLRGLSSERILTTNAWGLRGDAVPGEWDKFETILAIGGSTTHGYYLDDSKTWPAQFQKILRQKRPNVWVGNTGVDGHSTRGHLVTMKYIVRTIRPSALIFMTGINDLYLSFEMSKRDAPVYQFNEVEPEWWEHFRLLQIARLWKVILIDGVPTTRHSNHFNYDPKVNPDAVFDTAPDDLSPWLVTLKEYRANLESLISQGKELSCKMAFMTQPLLFGDGKKWGQMMGKEFWAGEQKFQISGATYWQLLQVFNHELIEVCKENEIPCLDLASKISHSEENFYDIVHFTEHGALKLAEHAAEFWEMQGRGNEE